MAVGKVSAFDVKNGVWSSYVERLEMYFVVNQIKDELKLPTLIAVMGDEAYELLSNLTSPKKPKEMSYAEVVSLLSQHLQPAPSALAERFRFRQRRQASDENVASYVAELKKLARHCKFGSNLNENLRDQFVCGLRSDVIRQRLFAEDDSITYTKALKLAISLESAERDAAAVEVKTASSGEATVGGGEAPVHAVGYSGGSAGGSSAGQRGGRRARGATRGPARGQARGGATSRGRRFNCGGCGATDHGYNACRFRDYVCSRCGRTGHLRRVCPENSDASNASGGRSSTQQRLNYGETVEGASTDENDMEEDFHHFCLNDYRAV